MADSSGRGHSATITASSDFSLGQPPLLNGNPASVKSLGAFGTAQCQVAAHADFDATTALTLETWMKATGYNNGLLGRARYYIGTNSGNPYVYISAGGKGSSCSAAVNVLDGVRHYLLGTYDGTSLHLWVDGALLSSCTHPVGGPVDSTSGQALALAATGSTGADAHATIDEAAIYTVVLPDSRIQTHWALGSSSATAPPTATSTNTPSPTNTLPPVPTSTPSRTPTNTATAIPSNTPIPGTPTVTRTNTPLPTSTPTRTPTATAIAGTPGAYVWSQRFGGTTADSGDAVATDGAGNMLVAGFFTGSVNFGGGSLTSSGTDIFLAKYSPTGQYVWAIHTGNAGSNAAMGVAADSGGNVIITGKFQNSINFGCGLLSSGIASTYDIFVAKISAAGTCQWSKSFGSGNDDVGYGVAVDGSDNVIVTGAFVGRVSFGGTAFYSSNSSSGSSTFVAEYAPDGTHRWSKNFSATISNNGPDSGYAVAVDASGNVLVTGSFQGTEYFDGVNGVTSAGLSEDIYVAKLAAADGSYQWARTFGNTGSDRGYGVAVDGSGSVLLTGYFAGSVDFGGTLPLASTGPLSAFLAKYSSTGAYSWAQALTSTGVNTGYGVAVDRSSNVIVTGSFQGTTAFGSILLISAGSSDIFVAKYSAGGVVQWAHRYGSTSGDIGYGVAVDGGGNVVGTGYFAGTVDFGGGPLTSAGSVDIYVDKCAP